MPLWLLLPADHQTLTRPIAVIRPSDEKVMDETGSSPRAQSGHGNAAFVGRRRELDTLTSALEDAVAGRGRAVALSGAPGIGKTRTAREFADMAAAQGAKVMWGWCYEHQGAPP